ncbi:MAG: DUF1614 domain-containing protein [Bacillota bacterium]|nr:DUF1614 domain-containing protein [Bacillota bacterium]
MNIGMIFLLAAAIIIYLGFAQRALDRLRLSDRAALIFLAAMLIGGFLPDIPLGGNMRINLGGGVVPLILVGYLWSKAERQEISRSLAAVLITAAAVYATVKIMPLEPTYNFFLDPLYIIAIIAGLVGYISGRSRRGSFIAGSMAIVLNDIAAQVENAFAGAASTITIGGAGVFDAVVIAGFIALGLAEIVGETAERIKLDLGNEKEEDNPHKETEMDNQPEE